MYLSFGRVLTCSIFLDDINLFTILFNIHHLAFQFIYNLIWVFKFVESIYLLFLFIKVQI